jgi:hypothetical protein
MYLIQGNEVRQDGVKALPATGSTFETLQGSALRRRLEASVRSG